MQERRNSIANVLELRLSWINQLIWGSYLQRRVLWSGWHGFKTKPQKSKYMQGTEHVDRLMQERRNSSALAMELHLSCTNPLKLWSLVWETKWYKAWKYQHLSYWLFYVLCLLAKSDNSFFYSEKNPLNIIPTVPYLPIIYIYLSRN